MTSLPRHLSFSFPAVLLCKIQLSIISSLKKPKTKEQKKVLIFPTKRTAPKLFAWGIRLR